jgi:BCD family chlorophyll transporter-like MFS transporter
MGIVRNIRLGLLHVAVAITFVLINGILNRVMIHDLGIAATLVAVLVVLPYLLSPAQVWIGQYSDTHPILGYRRTTYIALGVLLCLGGTLLTPLAAFMIADQAGGPGLLLGGLAFGLWGIGFNMAVVSYLALASDLSDERTRSRTVSIMWFMMITAIIITAIITSRALDPYSPERLLVVFGQGCAVALGLTLLGLVGLEPRLATDQTGAIQTRQSQVAALRAVLSNPQARLFFIYLILMLAAILGQDVLLEPFGAAAFGMSVRETTQLTAAWGGATLAALLLHGLLLSRWLGKKAGATLGAVIATSGLLLIAASGLFELRALFVPGVAVLGFGTGFATATNLALMLDMTTPEQVGLFIGAWGVSDALARGLGTLMGGVVRDAVTFASGSASGGYITVFLIEAILLAGSLILLHRVDVSAFREKQPTLTELVALVGDA